MESLLDDFPSVGSLYQREDVGHVDVRSRQFTGLPGYFEMRHRERMKNVHAGNTRLDALGGPVPIYPIEEKFSPACQLVAHETKKRRARMESRTHDDAFALFAAIDVELKHANDGVVICNVECGVCHGSWVGTDRARLLRLNMANDGRCRNSQVSGVVRLEGTIRQRGFVTARQGFATNGNQDASVALLDWHGRQEKKDAGGGVNQL